MISVPAIFVILAVVFVIANLVLWVLALLGSKGGQDSEQESLIESTVAEMAGTLKGVRDALNELIKGNNARAESKNELPLGIDKTMDRHSKDIEELNGHVDKLKTSIDNNSSQMENLKNLMEDLDTNLVKLSGAEEKDKED